VLAEGFTTIGPHWQETIWDNLKPSFDKAVCEGLNLLVWHAFVCSPREMGMPGQQYFAGTHFNPNTTWWEKSEPFIQYINRIQSMMQQGVFFADACFYYGDHVPNFAQLKRSNPAGVLPGYDYDVLTEEAFLERMQVREGRLVMPDGLSYRVLVLPNRDMVSLPVLEKLRNLIGKGATVIGPKPAQAATLKNYEQADSRVRKIAAELWDAPPGSLKGRVLTRNAREVLMGDGVPPDFELAGQKPDTQIDYIHRRMDEADIYFLANRSNRVESLTCLFRQADRAPELWNPLTGRRQLASDYSIEGGRTRVPIRFEPCGSWIVVFRRPAAANPSSGKPNFTEPQRLAELAGAWSVSFNPDWGGPKQVEFETLTAWNAHPDPGIRYYSGKATYRKTFTSSGLAPGERQLLDLGHLRELAEVRLNGKPLGIVWAPPFRVDITPALKQGENTLEVEVINFWPNRIIGDQFLAEGERRTRTNIRKLTRETTLMESGLMGPVTLLREP
jgi:hypothetical protein